VTAAALAWRADPALCSGMDKPPACATDRPPAVVKPPSARAERLAREAAALRANLRKRKQQARARTSGKPD
jgi:hypothetical protein